MLVVTVRTLGMSQSPLGKRLVDLMTLGWGRGESVPTVAVMVLPTNSPDVHCLTGQVQKR